MWDVLEEKMGTKKVNLLIYGLSVIDGQNKRVLLNDVQDGKSLICCLEEYVNSRIKKYSADASRDTLFQFEQVSSETIRNDAGQDEYIVLYGRVKTGEYGIESELVDVDTKAVTKRTSKQADMMPFGFCIAIPAGDVDSGVIVLQTMGVYGMKLSLQRQMEKCIADLNPNLQLLFRRIAPKEYIDRFFEHGVLNKIRMIRYEIPEDESEKIGINYGVRQTKEERIIHKPIGFRERKKKEIQEWFAGQRSYTEIIEIEGFEYDDLKLEFSLGEGDKTLNLRELNNIVVNEDITSKVMQAGGHPIYEKLKPIMRDTAKKYLMSMGILVE